MKSVSGSLPVWAGTALMVVSFTSKVAARHSIRHQNTLFTSRCVDLDWSSTQVYAERWELWRNIGRSAILWNSTLMQLYLLIWCPLFTSFILSCLEKAGFISTSIMSCYMCAVVISQSGCASLLVLNIHMLCWWIISSGFTNSQRIY